MSSSTAQDHQGWEHIWAGGDIPPRYRTLAEPNASVVEWAGTLPPNAYILDVGCGVGRHVVYLGGRGFRMAGQDISPTGVAMTQQACAERGISFEGRVSDMTTLAWEGATFDAVLATATIHHHLRADILRALAEVCRVLKTGGTFLVDFPSTATAMYQEWRDWVAAGTAVEVEPNTFVEVGPSTVDSDGFLPHHFCDEADVRDLLGAFDDVRLVADLRDITLDNGTSIKVGKWVAIMRKPHTAMG